jgi:hypothetical protein
MPVERITDLIRAHGNDTDLPELNKRRKISKDTYIVILLDVLSRKFDYDLPAVKDFITAEANQTIKAKKGFGAR